MGGYGSGTWDRSGTKRTADSCRQLDVRRWQRGGLLGAGTRFDWTWTREGKQVADIGVSVGEGSLTLEYRYRQGEGDWESVVEDVALVWTNCNYGGRRAWFVCPGVKNGVACRRRVAILYLGGRYFLCRHCYDLVYASQREDDMDRTGRRAQKIRFKLGGAANRLELLPDRPKGMHARTYHRLFTRVAAAESAYHEVFIEGTQRLIDRFDRQQGSERHGRGR